MKSILTVFLLSLFLFVSGQQHVKLPGTKWSLVPPTGFIVSPSFSGVHNQQLQSSIMINEVPGSYQTVVDGFTANALKSRGMNLIDKQTIDFNNTKATILKVQQNAGGMSFLKHILVFQNIDQVVLINGIYPETGKEAESEIKTSMFSFKYNPSQSENPLDAALFSIDVSGTDFKLIKYMSGSLVYSTDGKMPTEKPTFIVANSIGKVTVQHQKAFAHDRLRKLPRGELNQVQQNNEVEINNLKGIEIIAHGKTRNNGTELVYQVILFDDSGYYYLIIGKAKEEFDKYLQSFRRIVKTFKRK